MALTRAFLKGMGLTEEQVSAIVEANAESIEGVKEERDRYKKAAESVPALEKKIKALENADGENWEERYNKEHEEFEAYKKEIDAKAELEAVKDAYRDLLKAQNISEKRINTILKWTDFSGMKLTKEGKIANEEKVLEKMKEDWSDVLPKESEQGADISTPPNNTGANKYSRADIYRKDEHGRYVMSTQERQAAIAENPELFGY